MNVFFLNYHANEFLRYQNNCHITDYIIYAKAVFHVMRIYIFVYSHSNLIKALAVCVLQWDNLRFFFLHASSETIKIARKMACQVRYLC